MILRIQSVSSSPEVIVLHAHFGCLLGSVEGGLLRAEWELVSSRLPFGSGASESWIQPMMDPPDRLSGRLEPPEVGCSTVPPFTGECIGVA